MIMTSNVCLFLTILANKCTVRSMVIFLYIFFFCCTLYHAFPLLSWKITNILQVFLLGMFGGPGSLSQKLLFPNETIFVRLLERGGFVVIHFAYCCSASFLHWWNVYHCKTHVCLVSAGHVFEVPEAFLIHRKLGPTLIMIKEMVCSFDFHIHITIFIRFKHQSIAMEENRDFIAICVSSVDCLLYKFS